MFILIIFLSFFKFSSKIYLNKLVCFQLCQHFRTQQNGAVLPGFSSVMTVLLSFDVMPHLVSSINVRL